MAIRGPARFDDGNRRQISGLDVFVDILSVLNMLGAERGVGHDVRCVLERIADVAVGVERILEGRI